MNVGMLDSVSERTLRRSTLVEIVKQKYSSKTGTLLFLADFERSMSRFVQDSSFYYFFGIEEPAIVALQSLTEHDLTWVIPAYGTDRGTWCASTYNAELLATMGVKKVALMGDVVRGYSLDPWCIESSVKILCAELKKIIQNGGCIFTELHTISAEKRVFLNQLELFVPELKAALIDVSDSIVSLRRKKSEQELECLYAAIEITAIAHQAAAGVIKPGSSESDVQAAIEYIFTENKAYPAYPSIVGSGKNANILHYNQNSALLDPKGLTLVDAGASFGHYCADVTRTYPASGKFTSRQKNVYQDVLSAQTFVAEQAKPGMFLNNPKEPALCLTTLARTYFASKGYNPEVDFPHGIGHFVGLDVHDVGSRATPLAIGDVITIEPGLYLKNEAMGIRIEDMYWIVEDGAVCLTDGIGKEITDIEAMMQTPLY